MICNNCGKKLKKSEKFCSNCGNQITKENNIEKKKNTGLIITAIILGFLVLILIVVGIWILLSGNKDNNEDNKENKKDNNEENIVIDNDSNEAIYNNYKFTVPNGFNNVSTDSYNYIMNSQMTMVYVSYPLNCKQIIDNKNLLTDALNNQGYNINSFDIKEENGSKYILVKGDMRGIEYGFVFYDVDDNFSIFVTIVSNTLSSFEEEWFDSAISFVSSAKKVE